MTQTSSMDAIAAAFRPGEHIYLAGSCSEATTLVQALLAEPERTRGLHLTTSFVPGINTLDPSRLHSEARLTGLFMQPAWRGAQHAGRYRHVPASYSGFVRLVREQLRFDTCVLQVSPPDAQGQCSLGPGVEFAPEVIRRSGRLIGVINPLVPRIPTAPTVAYSAFAVVGEAECSLRGYETGAPDARSRAIAAGIAGFIHDGAAIQIGLGKIPSALLGLIHDRRGLRLHSGMLSDGVMTLAEGGALDASWRHATCVLVGSRALYDWGATRHDVHVLGCGETHDPAFLLGVENLVAVNSALEVDLFGQCNLEVARGHAVSGAGGAPDFAYAASRAPGGVSIVALPASLGIGKPSRILGRLGDNAPSSLSRTDVDVVVTEHGAADLRGRSVHERAESLIAIAAPEYRGALGDEWRDIAARL